MTFTMVREQWAVFNRVGFSSTESARRGAFHYHDNYHDDENAYDDNDDDGDDIQLGFAE